MRDRTPDKSFLSLSLFSPPSCEPESELKNIETTFIHAVKTYHEIEEAILYAYAHQDPPAEKTEDGSNYHIRSEDYQLCKEKYEDFINQTRTIFTTIKFCLSVLPIHSEARQKFFDDFRESINDLSSKVEMAKIEFSGKLIGIKYAYEHPLAEDRRRLEWVKESEMNKNIMFGFS